MDPKRAVEHASAVAREAARLGIVPREPLVGLYQDYPGYLRQGGTASFTALLLERRLIDQAAYVRLDNAVPVAGPIPAHLRASQGSQSFQVPSASASPDPWLESDVAAAGVSWKKQTVDFEDVLDPRANWAKQTLDYHAVLDRDGADVSDGKQTGLYDQVLETGGGATRTGVYKSVIPTPNLPPHHRAPGEPDTDEYSKVLGVPAAAAPQPASPTSPGSERLDGSDRRHGLAGSDRRPGSEKLAGSDRRHGLAGSDRRPGGERLDGSDRRHGLAGSDRRPGSEQLAGSGKRAFPSGGLPDLGDSSGFDSDLIEPDSDDRLPIESEPRPGDAIGPYTVEKVLGRGGMGIIYRAHKSGSEERVALKVLVSAQEPGEQSDRKRQRFRREFEALRRLEHPQIVAVHDYGRQEPFDWYSMDYVPGFDFEQVLLRDRLDRVGKLAVFGDVCLAMAHAHERKVVHRDLKPQNVIVDEHGRGHVLDFGLAKILDQGLQMTRSGSTLGTPFYIAPEQLRSARDADARTDVFALGVILYELLTGQRPFSGETAAEVGNQILTTDPAPPSHLDPTIPAGLDAICMRALEKTPDDRYDDAGALHADLQRHTQGLQVQGKSGGLRRWLRRNRAGILGGLIASAILVPIVVYVALELARSGAP